MLPNVFSRDQYAICSITLARGARIRPEPYTRSIMTLCHSTLPPTIRGVLGYKLAAHGLGASLRYRARISRIRNNERQEAWGAESSPIQN